MKVRLDRVRLAFPELFTPKQFADGEPRYGAALLMDKEANADAINKLKATMKQVAEAKWGEKWKDAGFRKRVKLCLHDGSEKEEYDGYDESVMFVNANRNKKDGRPAVLNSDRTPCEDDGTVYAGCYVVALLDVWAQDNQYGKRINSGLMGVQFAGHGDSFAGAPKASANDFEDLGPVDPEVDSSGWDDEGDDDDPLA